MIPSEQLEQLDRLLHNRRGDSPAARRLSNSSSSKESLSMLEVLRSIDSDKQAGPFNRQRSLLDESIEQALSQASLLAGSPPTPILAVAGLLNAGKTSLVGTFLSPEGRARLLIGEANKQGTHRFVLWVPKVWQQHSELWTMLLKQIENIVGCQPEVVSDEPALAARQYNGECLDRLPAQDSALHDTMNIPLIATDAALDRWEVGLLDCPDIQSGLVGPREIAQPNLTVSEVAEEKTQLRQALLGKMLKLASAFVVVTPANAIQDKTVGEIIETARQANPGLRMLISINRVPRRYMTTEIAKDLRVRYPPDSFWRTYLAYHFIGPENRERIPENPNSATSTANNQQLPVFFRIDKQPPHQPPAAIPSEDFLVSLGGQLDRGILASEMLDSCFQRLQRLCREAIDRIQEFTAESQLRVQRLQRVFAEACLSFARDPSSPSDSPQLRLQLSKEIVQQFSESLERTAPWWAMPGRSVTRLSGYIKQYTVGVTSWLPIPKWIPDRVQESARWMRSQWRAGQGGRVLSESSFADTILDHDLSNDLAIATEPTNRPSVIAKSQAIIQRFSKESKTRLDNTQLDAYAAELWKRMPWKQRLWTGVAPAGLVFAPLLAVVMLPFDGGGSAVLVFASIKELTIAGCAGLGLMVLKSDNMPQIAESAAAWQQVSDIFAITCDEFGVPRPDLDQTPTMTLGNQARRLLNCQIAEQSPRVDGARPLLIELEPSFPKRLEQVLDNLDCKART